MDTQQHRRRGGHFGLFCAEQRVSLCLHSFDLLEKQFEPIELIIVIQEAGLDGFSIHRVLLSEGIESHVVDAASIATSRRRRRAKTDRIDGETLLRALLAHKRGEPRVCSMVRAPTPEDEDRRRICRERKVLIMERVQHVNRIKGLLFSQGASGYEPLRRDRRARLETLQTGDGRGLPRHLKAQVCRDGKDFPVCAYAFLLSSEKRASSAAISPPDTLCFDIFPRPGDSDVTSQVDRLSSNEMNIAQRSARIVVGATD